MNDLVSSATSAIKIVGRLREINKNIANAEFSNALADLAMELSGLKIQMAGLLEENDELKRKLADKKNDSLIFKDYAYFTDLGDGPFCPGCYDSKGKSIRLSKLTKQFSVFGTHKCPSCDETFSET